MDRTQGTMALDALAAGLAADLERIVGLFRLLVPPSGGLSMTAAVTLAGLERLGPQRLTDLAAREGVSQPAMTQLITRLEEAGLAHREASPADGRVVLVAITDEGRATLAGRRSVRTERLGAILAELSPGHLDALAAALPALDALANVPAGTIRPELPRTEEHGHRSAAPTARSQARSSSRRRSSPSPSAASSRLGLVFFGWGLFVALLTVFGAPRARRPPPPPPPAARRPPRMVVTTSRL